VRGGGTGTPSPPLRGGRDAPRGSQKLPEAPRGSPEAPRRQFRQVDQRLPKWTPERGLSLPGPKSAPNHRFYIERNGKRKRLPKCRI
jgi:hypothetical protein